MTWAIFWIVALPSLAINLVLSLVIYYLVKIIRNQSKTLDSMEAYIDAMEGDPNIDEEHDTFEFHLN